MRSQSTYRTVTKVGAVLGLLMAVGACGSETDSSSDDTEAPSAALTDEPFCEQVDPAMVGEVLAMPADKVRVVTERAVGDEFEGMDEEGAPQVSVSNLCVFGSSTSTFTVSIQPDASEADVDKAIEELSSLTGKGSSEQCEPGDAADFGEPAGAFTCTSDPPVKRVRVVATGLIGDSMFYCAAAMNTGAGPEFPDATFGACRKMVQELSTAG